MVVDSYLVESLDREGVVQIPFTLLAVEQCGRMLFANVVALGAIVELTGVVRWESLCKAVRARVPEGTEDVNQKALDIGREAARNAREKAK
jgi:2-oxoglutarate ferredoxin oxidoreductase subunit gamma